MSRRKPTLDEYVFAILDRDEGVPYAKVLDRYRLTPNQFCRAVGRDISSLILTTKGEIAQTLTEIASDRLRTIELFNMGEEFVREQYDRVRNGEQSSLCNGILLHHENIKTLVYHALTSHNPKLASQDRKEVVQTIQRLPTNLQKYFHTLGLSGLMTHAFEKGKQNSPLAVLEVFDKVYQRKTGDASLFDLNQQYHLHKWGDNFSAPQSYWQNPNNVETAIYHTLTEQHPQLASQNRKEVIQTIQQLPTNLKDYFHSLRLAGLMMNVFQKGSIDSPLAVLEVFDKIYQKKTGDKSIFNLNQPHHLHKWGEDLKAPNSYWQNSKNVETAIYHTLTENHPQLATKNREKIIQTIQQLPTNLMLYFRAIGLNGLMMNAFEKGNKDSPLAVLETFDKAYQNKTRQPSLFDKKQKEYLKFDGKNRLIRQKIHN